MPVGGADFSVLVSELEGLDEAEDFIGVSAYSQVIDAAMSQVALVVDDEGTSERDASFFVEDSVVGGDLLGQIGEEGDLHFTKTSLVSRLSAVLHVREVGID